MKTIKEILLEDREITTIEGLLNKHPEVWIGGPTAVTTGSKNQFGEQTLDRDEICLACLGALAGIVYVYAPTWRNNRDGIGESTHQWRHNSKRLDYALKSIEEIMDKRYQPYFETAKIPRWNDSPERKLEDVMKVVREARV